MYFKPQLWSILFSSFFKTVYSKIVLPPQIWRIDKSYHSQKKNGKLSNIFTFLVRRSIWLSLLFWSNVYLLNLPCTSVHKSRCCLTSIYHAFIIFSIRSQHKKLIFGNRDYEPRFSKLVDLFGRIFETSKIHTVLLAKKRGYNFSQFT